MNHRRTRVVLACTVSLIASLLLTSTAAAETDSTPPVASTISSPAVDNMSVQLPVVLSGTASDETSVASVDIWVRQLGGSRPWLQADGSFTQAQAIFSQGVNEAGALSSSWSWEVPHNLPAGPYYAIVRAVDSAGNRQETFSIRRFRVLPADTTPPSTSITAPTPSTNVVRGLPTIRGTASDDTAVTSVKIWIRQTGANGLWLQHDGSLSTASSFFAQEVNSPGSPTSSWLWNQSLSIPDGNYRVIVRAVDAAGNQQRASTTQLIVVDTDGPAFVWVNIGVTGSSVDNPISFSGRVQDNSGTEDVRVLVRERLGLKRWLQADGTFGANAHSFDAPVLNPGALSSLWVWSNPHTLPAGRYVANVRPRDEAGNLDSGSQIVFTIS